MLYCDNCGADTRHRILRLDRTTRAGTGRVRGVARCGECRWTHPFESAPPARVKVVQVLSTGRTSERSEVDLSPRTSLHVGSPVPNSDTPARVRRLDTRDGRQVASAVAAEVATLWAVPDLGAIVRVSIVEGQRTRTTKLTVPPDTRYTVGEPVTIEATRLVVTAIRARGRTWRLPGEGFVAGEVQRLYCRRTPVERPGSRMFRGARSRPFPRL